MNYNKRYPGNIIHPTALIAKGVLIGTGNVIGPYCIIGYPPEWKGNENHTGQVSIGDNNRITGLVTIDSAVKDHTFIFNDCYLMKGVHIGHDACICDRVTISCGAKIGGHALIGDDCNIGLNAVVHQKQSIAAGCMIGMGAVITKKLLTERFKIYAGNPAKLIGENKQHPKYIVN